MKKFDKQNNEQPQQNTDRPYHRRGQFQRRPQRTAAPSNPYEHSVWFLNSFNKRQVVAGPDDSNESLIRKFKRIVEASGVMRELKRREYYQSRTQKRREKKKRALKRLRKRLKMDESMDFDTKKVFRQFNQD